MIAAVVLCFGDAQVRNLESLDSSTFATFCGVVVVAGDSVRPSFPCILVESSAVAGFNAGSNRDIGLCAVSEMWPDCGVVFLDGDCIPGHAWASKHISALSVDAPTVSCGARTQGVRRDPRTLSLDWQGQSFTPSMIDAPRIATLPEIIAHRATWSCNLGLNRAAISLLQSAGEKLHGSRRIFSPEFDGRWGGEDTALGIAAHHAGCRVVVLTEESAVEHIPHDPFRVSRINLDLIPEYADRVRKEVGSISFHHITTSTRG